MYLVMINTYGKTKLAGEIAIQKAMPTNAIIIRTSWMYSEYGNNFVKTMLRLGGVKKEISVVSDQIGSPTYATDLAEAILTIVNDSSYQNQENITKIYHYSNEGETSWRDFAEEIFKLKEINCKIEPVTTEQFSATVTRSKNTLMSTSKIVEVFGVTSIYWRSALKRFLMNWHEEQ